MYAMNLMKRIVQSPGCFRESWRADPEVDPGVRAIEIGAISLLENGRILVSNNFYPCISHLFEQKIKLMSSLKCSHLWQCQEHRAWILELLQVDPIKLFPISENKSLLFITH
jgi:hypothetical protein